MKANPWRSRWLAVLPIVLLGLFIWSISSTPKIPVYQGKTFYEWTTELQKAQSDYTDPDRWRKVEAASAAIRAIGTNGLPFVMADLRERPRIIDILMARWAPRAKFLRLSPRDVSQRWVRGICALEVLGPLGKPYLPELISMVSNSTGYSEGALLAVGPDALPAFTNFLAYSKYPQTGNLIGAFANAVYANRIKPEQAAVAVPYLVQVFKSPDTHGRWYAASALGAVHQDPQLCVPLLIQGINDPTPSVRESCVQALGAFGEEASRYAGQLALAFDQSDALTRRAICRAMGNFHSAAQACVPILVRGATDTDVNVRLAAVVSLGQLNSSPEQAIPTLMRGATDSSPVVRLMAVQSLGQFGYKATNAMEVLQGACSDPEASVRSVATTALARVKRSM